jgi:hypothetical protein
MMRMSLGAAAPPPAASAASLLQSRRGFVQMNTGSDSTGAGDSNSSRRDQESFLAQYCPLEVLGLYEGETSMRNIVNAYNAKKKAAAGNKYKTTQIERAYSILTDPKSPYFEKASWQQTHRQRLLLELMPDTQRRQAKFYMYGWGSFAIIGVCILAYSMLHPIFRIHRAATRT